MKQLHLIAIILFLSFQNINAQVTEVVTGLNNPFFLLPDQTNNNLYISEYNGNNISSIDLSAATPTTATNVLGGISGPTNLVLNGNDLYVMKQFASKITKIDLTATTLSATDVITGLNIPVAIALKGNDLYISEFGSNRISKIDITVANPTKTNVLTGLQEPSDIAVDGNDLYFIEQSNKVSKIDLTATTPTKTNVISGLNTANVILIDGNNLYITENGASKISIMDITATPPILTDVVTGLNFPTGLAIDGDELYFAEWGANKVSKINISTLSVVENTLTPSISLHSNPTSEYIQLSNLTTSKNYTIYNTLAAEITKGTISNNEKIDVQDFANGLYFLKFDNGHTLKFLKK